MGHASASWFVHVSLCGRRIVVERESGVQVEIATVASAKELRDQLTVSIEEAKSVPRFSEEDIKAIDEEVFLGFSHETEELMVRRLRVLRKPRSKS